MMYDLIILGGGPAGYLAAERAAGDGLSVTLIEKTALGGECLNRGCVPTKTLLNSAKIFDYSKHGKDYGVHFENAVFNHGEVLARKDKVVKRLVTGIKAALKALNVRIVEGEGQIIGKTDGFNVKVGEDVYAGKNLIIATGSIPAIPPIPGLEEALKSGFAVTNREMLEIKEIPEKLAIIGGGVIGLEFASYFNSAGSDVTVIEMLPYVAGATDRGISDILLKTYAKRGIDFKLDAKVTGITKDGVEYVQNGGKQGIAADRVLVSIGRRPNTAGIGLESLGVETSRGAIVTDEFCRTNIPGVYAAGDVNGKSMLAHTAYREAEVAIKHILGKRDYMRYNAIPAVIYTNPEVAGVGETEESAKEKGIDYIKSEVSMMYSGRYVAENTEYNGICKVLVEKKTGKIIGVHLIGSYASEIIISGAMMIECEMRVSDVKELVFPHPTVSEIIREAIFKL